jgi:Zn-finger nucleic acid-binding protein/ribosomal protein L40E
VNNPLDARFCINCGASLTAAATGPTTRLDGTVCPNCGAQNPENARFCAVCGQQLAAESVPRSRPYPGTPAWQRQGAATLNCPVCREVTLVMADRQGIEVDYCPNCRGVWLDRGELDKIIERVALTQGEASRNSTYPPDRGSGEYREQRDYDDDYRRKKKRRGLLDELFDFD